MNIDPFDEFEDPDIWEVLEEVCLFYNSYNQMTQNFFILWTYTILFIYGNVHVASGQTLFQVSSAGDFYSTGIYSQGNVGSLYDSPPNWYASKSS